MPKIIKSYCYNRRFDISGTQLKPQFVEMRDEDIETDDWEQSRINLAQKYKCDFVEVAVININPKTEKL